MPARISTAVTQQGGPRASAELIDQLQRSLGDTAPVLVLVFASTAQPLGDLAPALSAAFPAATVLGASSAGEFTERGDVKGGVSAIAVAGDFRVFGGIATGLKAHPERAVEAAIAKLPTRVEGYPYRTAILLLDPLAGNGEEVTLLAAALLGDDIRLAGGAAGDDLAMKATHVSLGGHAATDAVAIALVFSRVPLGVGVCHGHEPISGPLRVTRAEGNVVAEIDGRPAWDVWRERTRERAATRGLDVTALRPEDEGAYLLRYEGGLAAGAAYKIRAPLSRDAEGAIHFACGVPTGTVLRITESVPERQIDSAREAARRARAQLGEAAPAGAVVFDCICRQLILGGDFARAVRAMSDELGGVPVAGFETYGEIALDAGDMSGFHNTTSVVLAFPET